MFGGGNISEKFRAESYAILYLDELQSDSHYTTRMVWSDNTENFFLLAPSSKKKARIR